MNKWLRLILISLITLWVIIICLCIRLSAHAETICLERQTNGTIISAYNCRDTNVKTTTIKNKKSNNKFVHLVRIKDSKFCIEFTVNGDPLYNQKCIPNATVISANNFCKVYLHSNSCTWFRPITPNLVLAGPDTSTIVNKIDGKCYISTIITTMPSQGDRMEVPCGSDPTPWKPVILDCKSNQLKVYNPDGSQSCATLPISMLTCNQESSLSALYFINGEIEPLCTPITKNMSCDKKESSVGIDFNGNSKCEHENISSYMCMVTNNNNNNELVSVQCDSYK